MQHGPASKLGRLCIRADTAAFSCVTRLALARSRFPTSALGREQTVTVGVHSVTLYNAAGSYERATRVWSAWALEAVAHRVVFEQQPVPGCVARKGLRSAAVLC